LRAVRLAKSKKHHYFRAFAQLTPAVQELVRHRADGQDDAIGDAKWFVAAASQLKPRPHDNDHVQVGPKL